MGPRLQYRRDLVWQRSSLSQSQTFECDLLPGQYLEAGTRRNKDKPENLHREQLRPGLLRYKKGVVYGSVSAPS